MNKRIKKKRSRQVMICGIINLKNPWNTNTPIWKRIRASGRKLKMYYDIQCIHIPNRNHRVYDPVLLQEALKEVDSYE